MPAPRKLTTIQVNVDLSVFNAGPICGDFDEDCDAMAQDDRERCAAGFIGGIFEADPVDNCPYARRNSCN